MATKIDKPTEDRPHFFMAYGTKDYAGLKTFRDNEYKALQAHAANRARAKGRKHEARSGMVDFFVDHEADQQEVTVDDDVKSDMALAGPHILAMVEGGPMKFCDVAGDVMENFMLRETNVKVLVVQLAREGKLEDTWGGGNSRPDSASIIKLVKAVSR